jgi:hypothetical protein
MKARFWPLLLLASLTSALSSTAHAQETDSAEAPQRPFIGPLPANFSLVKKFTYPSDDPSLTADDKASQGLGTNTKEVDVVKSGPLRKDTETFLDGTACTIWREQFYRMTTYAAHPDGVAMSVAGGPNDSPQLGRYRDPSDFPELAWIDQAGPAGFQGIQMQRGRKCYAFKSGDQTAWVDISTKMPVLFKSKLMEVAYTFSDAPDEPLQLPDGYAAKLEKFKRALRGQG